jgi:hypothetical protein
LCDTVAYGVRERLGEILREHLTASVRNAVAQSAMRGESAAGSSTVGLH